MKTLEEAVENHLQKWRLLNNIHLSNILHAERCKNDFIAGANWQAERMYSEEDMEEAFTNGLNRSFDSDFDRWLSHFKKK
jgi:hypothetical protein